MQRTKAREKRVRQSRTTFIDKWKKKKVIQWGKYTDSHTYAWREKNMCAMQMDGVKETQRCRKWTSPNIASIRNERGGGRKRERVRWKSTGRKQTQDRRNFKRDRTQDVHVKTSFLRSLSREWCDNNVLFYIWLIFNWNRMATQHSNNNSSTRQQRMQHDSHSRSHSRTSRSTNNQQCQTIRKQEKKKYK